MRLRDMTELARANQPAVTTSYSSERADNLGMFIVKEIADLHKDSGSDRDQLRKIANALFVQAQALNRVIEGFEREMKKAKE